MQALELIEIGIAALAGAAVGASIQRWHARQKITALELRLARTEEARNGAVERSAAAREQIGQLSKAISELRRSHQPARHAVPRAPDLTAEERRALAERALAAAAEGDDERHGSKGKVLHFANTEPMQF